MPSPLVRCVPAAELPDDLKTAHQHSMQLRGDATFFEAFGNHPELYRWYIERFYGELFRAGRVARRFKELGRLRLSLTHGCRFCNQGNREDAREAGFSEAEIDALDRFEDGHFSTAEQAVLQLADRLALTQLDGTLDADLHECLSAHFDDAEIMELGLLFGLLAGAARFLFAFDLVEKETDCRLAQQL